VATGAQRGAADLAGVAAIDRQLLDAGEAGEEQMMGRRGEQHRRRVRHHVAGMGRGRPREHRALEV
jgi:hypothetical protein